MLPPNANTAAGADDAQMPAIRRYSRANIHTQTQADPKRRHLLLAEEAAAAAAAAEFDSDDCDSDDDRHSAEVHTPGGVQRLVECRSHRKYPDNDNWAVMGMACHNQKQRPAVVVVVVVVVVIAVMVRSDVDSCHGTGKGRSRTAAAVGGRHNHSRQIHALNSRHDNHGQ